MHCAKGGDIREYLGNLCYKQEEIAAARVDITDKEYECTILHSIPSNLVTFVSQIMSSATLVHHATSINVNALINLICEEAEQLKSRHTRGQPGQGGKKEATNEALAATSSNGKKKCHKGKCHNCGKAGHWARECHSPKEESTGTQTAQASGTSSKPENKPVSSVNVTIIHNFEGDGFWMAKENAHFTPIITDEPDPLLGTLDDVEVVLQWKGEEILPKDEWIGAVITQNNETKDNCICVELYNSGATHHISPYQSNFTSYAPLVPPVFLNTANQQQFPAAGCRTLVVRMPNSSTEMELTLHGALHMPAVSYTLISLAMLDEEGYHAHIGGGHLEITSPQGEQIGHIDRTHGCLYKVIHALDLANAVEPITVMELHHHLSHIAVTSTCKLVESGAIVGIKLDPGSQEADCNTCIYVCATCLPVPKIRICLPAENFGDEVHTNVWGPAPIATHQGRKYFVTFMDDTTRYTTTFLIHTKDKAFDAYKSYEAWAITQQHCRVIKVLCSNHGGEYLSSTFDQHLIKAGTARKLTTHDTPQLNGIAEWLNCTLLEQICALMHTSSLPKIMWGKALRHATWLKNWMAMCSLNGKMPFEALYRQPPDLSARRIWSCPIWVHDINKSKLNP